jgi:hypothetical protein
MASPTTRSIDGATYVPIDWDNEDDTGGDESRALMVRGFKSPRINDRANLVITLLGDRQSHAIIADAYRTRFLESDDTSLTGEARNAHTELLSLLDSYRRTNSYKSLVTKLGSIELTTLRQFTRNWLSVEKDALTRSMMDIVASAREVASQPAAKSACPEMPAAIEKFSKELTEGFRIVSDEIARLRGEVIGSHPKDEDAPQQPTTKHLGADASILLAPKRAHAVRPAAPVKPRVAVTGSIGISTDDIWRRMWESGPRRVSAKFIAGYMAPGQMFSAFRREKVNSLLRTATEGVVREAAVGLPTDVALDIAEGLLATEAEAAAIAREHAIIEMLNAMEIEPAGYLALERLDFTPVGYVKGELVYSLPLTPGEQVTVSHKEWSNTTEEYVKIVEATFEEEREKALSEKTELAESTNSERQVTQRGEASAEASYSGAGWSVAVRGGWSGEWQSGRATEASTKRNQEITSKAASRSKKEHKLNFRVVREVHVEDEQVRLIQNTSDAPVRWDFHRLMQKWKIELYHVGERLTWDIVIPEPARFLLRRYWQLKALINLIEAGDPFNVSPEVIDEDSYEQLASQWNAFLEDPPTAYSLDYEGSETYQGKRIGYSYIPIEVPDGYDIGAVVLIAPNGTSSAGHRIQHKDPGDPSSPSVSWDALWDRNMSVLNGMTVREFHWVWSYRFEEDADHCSPQISLRVTYVPSEEGWRTWRMECWNRLREAARVQWITRLENLQGRRDRLIEELTGKDSLKLRQMEREEIMKAVLRWMLGPGFEFYQRGVRTIAETLVGEHDWGEAHELYRAVGLEHGAEVRFLNQAVEWENINWVTYPYFWSAPDDWVFKQSLDHPDFYHRNFLRAGWARVVLTIRPGFERAWLARMSGLEEEELSGDHPYLSLAQEIEARARTAYPYTPDPNREELVQSGTHVDTWFEYTPTGALDIREGEELLEQ